MLEHLVVADLFLTETARYADVVLPGASFAEKDGTYVNTERRIQLARKAMDPPGHARGDLEILLDLSRRLGLDEIEVEGAEEEVLLAIEVVVERFAGDAGAAQLILTVPPAASICSRTGSMKMLTKIPASLNFSITFFTFSKFPITSRPPSVVNSSRRSGTSVTM